MDFKSFGFHSSISTLTAKLQKPKCGPLRTVKTHLSDGQKFTWMSHARVVAFGRQESHPPTGLKSAP